ncbi:hypothetical protein BDN72DRAFT_408329 [Pluteus cervinus]|uniref:Uncharacterized protein n=1 Tax=Pluteus cervinus TaxID=181527 RepID=A0ACD3B1U8_9AGAR|nr:hypothetical protein BDN72DRAFT_408329 [Pluteus cervinus]
MPISRYFPHVNLSGLMSWATCTVIEMQPAPSRQDAKESKINPKIIGCEDVVWAGERMILITFERASVPSGPHVMLAHFPKGRKGLTTQALVGMTATIREIGTIGAPQIYAYMDYLPNPVGAEVVLMEKIPGQSLSEVWPTLHSKDLHRVCTEVVRILLMLFNNRGSYICTDLLGTNVNTRPSQPPAPLSRPAVLLTAPFDQGPLINMAPQPALYSAHQYLEALAGRIFRVFPVTPTGQPILPRGHPSRQTGSPLKPELTDEDVAKLNGNWTNWQRLVSYHAGGYYVPHHLSAAARQLVIALLTCRQFGIRHRDMRMSRFIVSFHSVGENERHSRVTLTGWEHAHRAPLWSCARWPLWMDPEAGVDSDVVREEERVLLRRLLVGILNNRFILRESWQFFVAHVFGATERWFEDCLSTHWLTENPLENCLYRLSRRWEYTRPGIEFPLARPSRAIEQAPKSRDAVAESVDDSSGEADTTQTQGVD